MLLGEINYKMGQKHRLAIPKIFRQELGQTLILSRGYEGCLLIVDPKRWQHITAPINQQSFLDVHARSSARFLLGGAHQVELDAQGRCVVPANLYHHAGFQDEVVFVGLGEWVEVWSIERWQQQLEQLQNQGSEMAQRLIQSSQANQS